MAVPKKKVSSARRDKRRANWKLEEPTLTKCPNCGTMNLRHTVCENCGKYRGKDILEVKEEA